MSKEIYIVIGLCVFAFLLEGHIKKSLQNPKKGKKQSKKKASKKKELSSRQIKLRRVFTIAMLIFVFCLLIFMIPALSRDILSSNGIYSENLILRIIIVGFSLYILFMGYIKLRKGTK